jgi:hypothetical protein
VQREWGERKRAQLFSYTSPSYLAASYNCRMMLGFAIVAEPLDIRWR